MTKEWLPRETKTSNSLALTTLPLYIAQSIYMNIYNQYNYIYIVYHVRLFIFFACIVYFCIYTVNTRLLCLYSCKKNLFIQVDCETSLTMVIISNNYKYNTLNISHKIHNQKIHMIKLAIIQLFHAPLL